MIMRIYQAEISKEQYDEVNENGWEGVEWGMRYISATSYAPTFEDIRKAFEFYTHTMNFESTKLDLIWVAGNPLTRPPAPRHAPLYPSWETEKSHKSISVGDVFIDTESKIGYVVHSIGYGKLTEAQVKEFETNVTAHVPAIA